MKHTPGPWIFEQETPDELAHVSGGQSPYPSICTVDPGKMSSAEQNANARLIAAAPELLEAAEELLRGLEDDPRFDRFDCIDDFYNSPAIKPLVQAIRKATGGAE